jgi:hypothetical protein
MSPCRPGRRFSPLLQMRLIRKAYLADPLICPKCGGHLRILSFVDNPCVIEKILRHLKLWEPHERPTPLRRSIALEPDADFLDWAATARQFDAIDGRSRSPRRTLSAIETGLHWNSAPRRWQYGRGEELLLTRQNAGGSSPLPFCLLGQNALRNSWSHLPCRIMRSDFQSMPFCFCQEKPNYSP